MSDPIALRILAEPDDAFVRLIEQDGRFSLSVERCSDPQTLPEVIGDARIVVTRSSTPMTASVIQSSPSVEVIAQATAGADNIDLEEAGRRGVTVITTPGANSAAVAESVLGAMITLQRRLPHFSAEMKRGLWDRGACSERSELGSTSIGIVGVGNVGSRVARLVAAVGARPLGYDPYVSPEELQERGVDPVDTLDALVRSVSILTLHVPLTAETREMIGKEEIGAMQEPRIVINTSRGSVVDPVVIREALEVGVLDGAWIDVFPDEPASLEGWEHPNLLLTPHIAGCTEQARNQASRQLYEAICAAFNLQPR